MYLEFDNKKYVCRLFFLRVCDIVLSIVGLVVTLPIIAIVCLVAYAGSGSPLFFQERVGRQQKPFTIVKFRTMRKGTRAVGTHDVNATAITGVGRVLRRTKMDELPQLLNVLAGQMSFVGPRPCLPMQVELIAERQKRGVYDARPGVTGLAQINDVDMSTPRKLARYDALMIGNMTLGSYFYYIFATVLGKGLGDRVKS